MNLVIIDKNGHEQVGSHTDFNVLRKEFLTLSKSPEVSHVSVWRSYVQVLCYDRKDDGPWDDEQAAIPDLNDS